MKKVKFIVWRVNASGTRSKMQSWDTIEQAESFAQTQFFSWAKHTEITKVTIEVIRVATS